IIVMMLVYVVPRVVGVFESTNQELPFLTQALITLSDFLQAWWLAVAAVIALVAIGIGRMLRVENIRRGFHRWLLRAPVIGRVNRGINTARFTRTLSILTSSGVPVLEALRISATVVGNLPMRDAVQDAAVRVSEGGAVGRSLGQ